MEKKVKPTPEQKQKLMTFKKQLNPLSKWKKDTIQVGDYTLNIQARWDEYNSGYYEVYFRGNQCEVTDFLIEAIVKDSQFYKDFEASIQDFIKTTEAYGKQEFGDSEYFWNNYVY